MSRGLVILGRVVLVGSIAQAAYGVYLGATGNPTLALVNVIGSGFTFGAWLVGRSV